MRDIAKRHLYLIVAREALKRASMPDTAATLTDSIARLGGQLNKAERQHAAEFNNVIHTLLGSPAHLAAPRASPEGEK